MICIFPLIRYRLIFYFLYYFMPCCLLFIAFHISISLSALWYFWLWYDMLDMLILLLLFFDASAMPRRHWLFPLTAYAARLWGVCWAFDILMMSCHAYISLFMLYFIAAKSTRAAARCHAYDTPRESAFDARRRWLCRWCRRDACLWCFTCHKRRRYWY